MRKIEDAQIEEYVKSMLAGEEIYKKWKEEESSASFLESKCKDFSKDIKKLGRINDKFNDSIKNKDIEEINKNLISMHTKLNSMKQQITTLSELYEKQFQTVVDNKNELRKGICHLDFEYHNGVFHIIMDRLLPKRVQYAEEARYRTVIRDNYKNDFIDAFNKYFSDKKPIWYREKVLLYFVHYYKEGEIQNDNDNLETKQIIDVITSYMLRDDAPKYSSIYIESKIGEFRHTEIYVIPLSDAQKFFTQGYQ